MKPCGMIIAYPTYLYTHDDAQKQLARLVPLDNPKSYPFDHFHAHAYNEILVFINGGGKHNINFHQHDIEDYSIHLLAAKDLHWVERSMRSSGFAIVYKEQFLQKLQLVHPDMDYYSLFSHSRVIQLNPEEREDFTFIFRELQQHQDQSAYMLQVIGAFITKIALLHLREQPMPKIFDDIVPQAIELIEQYYKTQRGLQFYADALHLTPRTLQHRFKKASATTLTLLLKERLLKEAKKLLCSKQMGISDIAFELGFKDPSHFTNWFKKNAHCLPLEYKYEND